VIVRQFNKDKDVEMNREVKTHKWTPLYRAGKKTFYRSIKYSENDLFSDT
jgi:hypothetical protein